MASFIVRHFSKQCLNFNITAGTLFANKKSASKAKWGSLDR